MAKKKREEKPHHHQSLESQIEDPDDLEFKRKKNKDKKRERDEEEPENELLNSKISGRVLKVAREQQEELETEGNESSKNSVPKDMLKTALAKLARKKATSEKDEDEDNDNDDDDDDVESDDGGVYGGDSVQWRSNTSNNYLAGHVDEKGEIDFSAEQRELIDPEDERALKAFLPESADGAAKGAAASLNLGDLLVSKLKQQDELIEEGAGSSAAFRTSAAPEKTQALESKVHEVFAGVGQLMSRYTAGKVPKAFKVIPSLKNWEEVLDLTNPSGWSPNAVYEATRLFVSNLNSPLAQQFISAVLLPRFRHDLRTTRKLHFAVFQALKKAAYKPAAFYKGLLLPLCQSQTCTLLEAVVLSSVLSRISIPVLHTGAALLRLASLPYQGTTSFFIRVLLDKKYALPYRVIDALVDHFVRAIDDERSFPVVWHQCFLCFVQRYKDEIRAEDVPLLRKVCSAQHHYKISPEVLRELDHGRTRGGAGGERGGAGAALGGAATNVMARTGATGGGGGGGKQVVEDPRDMAAVVMMEDYD